MDGEKEEGVGDGERVKGKEEHPYEQGKLIWERKLVKKSIAL